MNKRLLLLLLLAVLSSAAKAQYTGENPAAKSWYGEPDGINWLLSRYRPIYGFRPNETVASIGAGQGIREVVYSLMADSLTFYVQDIDPAWLEPNRLAKTVRTIYAQAGRADCSSTFVPVRGAAHETQLPTQFFDKIIIENSLHEFEHQADMLRSVRANLKATGKLFIWELTTKKPAQKHPGCKMPMFTDASLMNLLDETGFRLVSKTVVDSSRSKDAVYQFAVKP